MLSFSLLILSFNSMNNFYPVAHLLTFKIQGFIDVTTSVVTSIQP